MAASYLRIISAILYNPQHVGKCGISVCFLCNYLIKIEQILYAFCRTINLAQSQREGHVSSQQPKPSSILHD